MNGSRRFLPLTLAAVLVATAFSGCGKKSVGDCVKEGAAAADAGNWDSALKSASRGAEYAPENIDALLLKAVAAKHCGQHEVAYEAAAKAAALDRNNFSVQYTLGCVCMDIHARKGEAKQAFLYAYRLCGRDIGKRRDTLVAVCNLMAETNDPRLINYIRRLEGLNSGNFPKDNRSAAFRNQNGVALFLKKQKYNAIAKIDAALEEDGNDPNIVYNAACIRDHYRSSSGEGKARVRELYERYLKLSANDSAAAPIRALVQQRLRELGGK